jgi:DNA-binding NarL/FixJ family response regulator
VEGEADSGEALFALPSLSRADIALLDINLPGMSVADVARRLRHDYPDVKILAISGENTVEAVKDMLDAGIHGFISKQDGDANEISDAIRTVMSGLEYFGRDIASIIFSVYVSKKKTTDVTPEFSDREREVIELCRDGLMSKEIAERMGIKPNTVHTYKERIFQKLGINNTMEMVRYAIKNGIIRIEN